MSLFESLSADADTKTTCIDVLDVPTAGKGAVDMEISRIYDLYGKRQRGNATVSVLVGD